MEIKHNDSTELRPDGTRLMDAPVVPIDAPDFLRQIKSEPTWQNSDRNAMTIYKTDAMRIVMIALHKNAVIQEHSTNGVISVQIIDGEIDFTTEGKTHNLKKGQMIALHRKIPHKVAAVEESVFLLTVSNFID
ncbi:MAG: cupin domain-containing protein [Ginsengibacter sp.]